MSYAGAAANVVGGELQGWAALLDKQAQFDTYKQQLATQQGYRDQGAQLFQGFLGQATPQFAQGAMTEGRQARERSYNDLGTIPLSPTAQPLQQSNSSARDAAAVKARGQERATVGAYSDWALKETLNNIQNQEALRQLTNFAGGTASVFPLQMYKAQHSMDTLSEIGAAISSIGGGAANFAQFSKAPQQVAQPAQQSFQFNPYTYQGDVSMPALNQYLGYV